jgi:endonuclease/exonuclease/phosphatase (EEP) superfamily protein YafD
MVAIFAPPWIYALPLAALIPLSIALHRRSLRVLAVGTIVALFPVMGLRLPWRPLIQFDKSAISIRVLTCNVHHDALKPHRLAEMILSVHPDIILLQEFPVQFEPSVFGTGGWNVAIIGEMVLATRFPIYAAKEFPDDSAVHYTIETLTGDVDVFNVHLSSPHFALQDIVRGRPNARDDVKNNIRDRRNEARELNQMLQNIRGPLLIAGDFNLPPDSAIFRENFSKFSDAFATGGLGFGWTYRANWTATRIDHILGSSQWICSDCWVGADVGSPHRPLIADLSMRGAK